MSGFDASLRHVTVYLDRVTELNALYRAGKVKVHVPRGLHESDASLDDLVAQLLPASSQAMQDAAQGLFFSLPVAFDPFESVGPYLAAADRDATGQPYRFLDLGAEIATHAFGENDPEVVRAVLGSLPFVVDRAAHSEYQTTLSLRLKAVLSRIAPKGAPRYFLVNTGAESVENAIKSVLLNRVMTTEYADGGFVVSFEGAFHGRTLGSLAVTHRRKARLGFPTFDWPHIPFPFEQPRSPKATLQREERTLKQLWEMLGSGKLPKAEKRDTFRRELDAIDEFLGRPDRDDAAVAAFVAAQRSELSADTLRRAERVAAVLVEPIQGEGGVRLTTARFMQRLRLLTKIYGVPLVFDEVQTGWGATGKLWAHEHFDLPCPPDVVTWAKKAQNGVLFVSEALATFFQEEKKFNTTWEGDSAGMVRLLAKIDALDLDEVCRTGARAREGLAALAKEHREIIGNVRGRGVMLAFDVLRPDWREPLRDRAFRRGLLLLGAGERGIRFYPRYDMEPSAIVEALEILKASIDDLVGGRVRPADATPALRIRVGTLTMPLDTLELVDVTPATFESVRTQLVALEAERYDPESPLLKYPAETLEATVKNARAIGVALRDKVSGRLVGYALGSALEDHDEEGIASDPRVGENDTFYLQALTVPQSAQNAPEIENRLIEAVRERALDAGFAYLSTLIEARTKDTGPRWLQEAAVLERVDNYLGSGAKFLYLQAPLAPA